VIFPLKSFALADDSQAHPFTTPQKRSLERIELPKSVPTCKADCFYGNSDSGIIRYKSQASTAPLHLRSLKLGHGMFIPRSRPNSTSGSDNYLARLVKTSGLKTLHIYNGLFCRAFDENEEYLEVEWTFFECTSLHQLSVTMLGNDVREWLNTVSTSVRELIVTHQYGKWDPDLQNFNELRLPHLSMLFTPENIILDLEPTDVSSDIASPGSQDSFGSQDELDFESSNRQQYLNPEDRRELNFWACATVLDRLHDGGSKLSELYIDLAFETQWVRSMSRNSTYLLTIRF